jgi:DNA-binding winged helix-turn-helix (wHTH) protein
MPAQLLRFERFCLDPENRKLCRDGAVVPLNPRYFDALALLVREHGTLVSKERFFEEVWRGVPVTDEALTQCIRALRRQLGDSATDPRFIETVPKHGYRFIAPVETAAPAATPVNRAVPDRARRLWLDGVSGTAGAGVAGIVGGLSYGFAGTLQGGVGEASALIVVLGITLVLALVGGAGVSFGAVAARLAGARPYFAVLGGAAGGLLVGGAVKLVGMDAFALLLGHSPVDFTGAAEGAVLGGAAGFGIWRSHGRSDVHPIGEAGVAGLLAGLAIAALGGHLLGGSLAGLAASFPASQLRLDAIGALFGEPGFGRLSELVTAGMEGALFAACITGATIVPRRWAQRTQSSMSAVTQPLT